MKTTRKFRLQNVTFLLVILKMCVCFGQWDGLKKVIVIDPGHGGLDSGAIGIHGIQEKEVVLNVANEIIRLNTLIFNGEMDLYVTRYDDQFIPLASRSLLAKSLHADYFVSIHCNAGVSEAVGMEVFIHPSQTRHTQISKSLGKFIIKESANRLGFVHRGVKFADFQVLRDTTEWCPAVLIEIGFITNPDEANYFSNSKNIRAMALAILMGLYQQITWKP